MASTQNNFAIGIPVKLSASAIEKELAAMWQQKADDNQGHGVTRITLANVIWLGSTEQIPNVRQTFARLVTEYPCRLFLLESMCEADAPQISAFVNAYCFVTGGERKEVCCEEIHLQFGPSSAKHVRGAILPLLVPDVPACIWLEAREDQCNHEVIVGLTRLADRIVTESAELQDPAAGLEALTSSTTKMWDLMWFRNEPLREQIAAAFDDPQLGRLLPKLNRLRLGWRGERNHKGAYVSAALIAGWLGSRLGWKTSSDSLKLVRPDGGEVAVEFAVIPGVAPKAGNRLGNAELHFESGESVILEPGTTPEMILRRVFRHGAEVAGQHRMLHVRTPNDAQALRHAFSARRSGETFHESAILAAPLLRAALNESTSR